MNNSNNIPVYPSNSETPLNRAGLTLRDKLAMEAMPTVAAKQWRARMTIWDRIASFFSKTYVITVSHSVDGEYIAHTSYEIADAMLAHRELTTKQ